MMKQRFTVKPGSGFWRKMWVVMDNSTGKQISGCAEKATAQKIAKDWQKKIDAIREQS